MPFYENILATDNFSEDDVRNISDQLRARYDEPWRHYHTNKHLDDVIDYLLDNRERLNNPRIALWAALGHDAIYFSQMPSGVNEELSAQLIEKLLQPYLPQQEVGEVGRYIRATANHDCDRSDLDLALFLDADMKILGASELEFDEYSENIAKEYKNYNPEEYRIGRLAVLRSFEAKDRLFISDVAHDQFEKKAKENIARSIKLLNN